MKRLGAIAFVLGAVGLVALIFDAGAAAVGRALGVLGAGGLAIIALLHLPVIALLGQSWWFLGRDEPGGRPLKFIWARLLRDAAAENLPFSQLGGYALGARALHLAGVKLFPASISLMADLVIEFAAKLGYVIVGLLILLYLSPGMGALRALALAAGVLGTGCAVAFAVFAPLKALLERVAVRFVQCWPSLGLASQDIHSAFDRIFARDGRLLVSFLLHLTCWGLGAAEAWVSFALMGVHIGPLEAVAIDSLAGALRTLAFLVPAAVGVQEAAYVLVSAVFGIPAAQAIALSLARRARDLVIGVPGLAAWQIVEGKRAFARGGDGPHG
jgi:glycosyltransferase 2 family protein